MVKNDSSKIKELMEKGIEKIIERENLLRKLLSGKKLRIKHGIDPTGPKIHLGRALQFWKLKEFQNLGHTVVLIIGDFTAQIGDASDKETMRKPLSQKEVAINMKGYLGQIGKILDMKKVELHYNSEWFLEMKVKAFIDLQMLFSVQQLINRRNFKKRWEENKPIGFHELDYPIFQGYDSLMVRADVETGGADQLFNLKAGRQIQSAFGQNPQDIMTLKMLWGLDGRKMSTSWGNIITLLDPPSEIYGKIMSMKDELIDNYFDLATRLPKEEISEIKKLPNPRDQKAVLAKEIVGMYKGEKEAAKAAENFDKIFRFHEMPSNIKIFKTSRLKYPTLDLLFDSELAESKSEAKRMVEGGGVDIKIKNKNLKIKNWKEQIEIEDGMIIQFGKRKFIMIKVK